MVCDFHSAIPLPSCILVAIACLVGCDKRPVEYQSNRLHVASLSDDDAPASVQKVAETAKSALVDILGEPDLPKWPAELPATIDLAKVTRSAGPVGRDESKVERGLFRKHCVQCHGITGDGTGPAALLLAPYARDFRRGTFKFKSTPLAKKPTHDDIVRTIENGLSGTSMPAFGTLNQSEAFAHDVDALAHYVRFLSIRGETERRLIREILDQDLTNPLDAKPLALQILMKVANDWETASSHSVHPEPYEASNAESRMESIKRGSILFQSELTACSKCHGEKADGEGKSQDFDEWTKDWTIRAGIDPLSKSEWRSMKPFGALKPVVDRARNLRLGSFRGGASRQEIYRRLVLGIEGSPMPAVARKENGNPGLDENDIRDLVEYVVSLSESEDGTASREGSHAKLN